MSIHVNIIKKPLQKRTADRRKQLEGDVSRSTIVAAAPNDLLPQMQLEKRKLSSLKSARQRARKTDPDQLARVMRSITTLRQSVPVLIDKSGRIIEGHVVVQALKALGELEVWCVILEHLDDAQKDLLHLTLNRLSETGEWDLEALSPLLVELDELGFDLTTTGFTLPELDILMSPPADSKADPAHEHQEPPKVPVSCLGDLWQLGEHRLLCADSTDRESYAVLLKGELVSCVFTDCPWNIKIDGFVSGLGKTKHKDFKMAAGEMTSQQFAAFVTAFTEQCAAHLNPGGAFFSCIDWRSVSLIIDLSCAAGLKLVNIAVWNKGSGGMGSYLRSQHEMIPVFCKGEKLAVNNVELGKNGRYRSNVWTYPGANRKGSSAANALKDHPTPKPVEMVADALLDVTHRGELVLDAFMGSGTTLLAAESTGRQARGIELDPAYVDVCIRRWEQMTGEQAILSATGQTYRQVEAERLDDHDDAEDQAA